MKTIQQIGDTIRAEVGKVIVGQSTAMELLLVGLFSGGHMLLEDVPGTGKTVLAKSLAASMGGEFHRIQCTP
ncbi:MAG: MoxR family ATPase, partial [Tumebacillaceae bacterium]